MPTHSPRRIACLQPSATAILASVGELTRIAACTRYCVELCPEVATHTPLIIADSWTAQSGQILAVRPDLVITSVPYQEKSVIEILKAGLPFLGLAPRTLKDIYADIAMIAGIVGASEKGEQVIANMQAEISSIEQRTRDLAHPRVYCEEWGKPLIHSQPWVAELVTAAGGQFIGSPGEKTIAEAILAENPEVMIAAWCGARDRVPLKKIIRDRGWSEMPAVRSGRVYCIPDEFLNTPAPSLIHGLHALASAIHPGICPGVPRMRCIMQE